MLKFDLYELTMGQAYFKKGRHETQATFEMFYRKPPFNVHSVVMCGQRYLSTILHDIEENGWLSRQEYNYLLEQGFDQDYLNYLSTMDLDVEVLALEEGSSVYPMQPMVQVNGPVLQGQLLETIILNTVNHQSLIATKARQIKEVVRDQHLADFSYRRAHGDGALWGSRAAYIGGCDSTSNVEAGFKFGIPVSGTMAHSYVMSYGDELQAFRDWAEVNPNQCTFLIDTYDTMRGLQNAIQVIKERNIQTASVRIDSGDLLQLSFEIRDTLDLNNLNHVKIIASGDLDTKEIKHLKGTQKSLRSPIDGWGVGTKLGTAFEYPALGGVYKLTEFDEDPVMKVSEEKASLPGQHTFFLEPDGNITIYLQEELGNRVGKDSLTWFDNSYTEEEFTEMAKRDVYQDRQRNVNYSNRLQELINSCRQNIMEKI